MEFLIPWHYLIQGGKEAYRRVRYREAYTFWRPYVRGGMLLIHPYADVDERRPGTQVWDWKGILHIKDFLSTTFRGTAVDDVSSDVFPDYRRLDANVLSVGGPIPNVVTRELLDRIDSLPYRFGKENNDHTIVSVTDSKLRLEAEEDAGGRITRDFGIITRVRNPFAHGEDKTLTVVAGCYGWGTYAALQLLVNRRSIRFLKEVGPEFQVLCTVEVAANRQPFNCFLMDQHPSPQLRRETAIALGAEGAS